MSRVADKIAMIARRATKVVAGTTMPRSTTPRARDFVATHMSTGFAGGLLRCTRCEGDQPFAASRALHLIPQNRVRGHVGLNQRFLNIPITEGRPRLGTWQGIYLCEHRNQGGSRRIVVTLQGEQA